MGLSCAEATKAAERRCVSAVAFATTGWLPFPPCNAFPLAAWPCDFVLTELLRSAAWPLLTLFTAGDACAGFRAGCAGPAAQASGATVASAIALQAHFFAIADNSPPLLFRLYDLPLCIASTGLHTPNHMRYDRNTPATEHLHFRTHRDPSCTLTLEPNDACPIAIAGRRLWSSASTTAGSLR